MGPPGVLLFHGETIENICTLFKGGVILSREKWSAFAFSKNTWLRLGDLLIEKFLFLDLNRQEISMAFKK
jgi:hypothetical protein